MTLKNQNLSTQEGSEIVVENIEYKSTKTTVPFLKDNEFDYSFFSKINGEQNRSINIIVFIFFVILIVTSVSNGANLTDGIDGLAAGSISNYYNYLGCFCLGVRKHNFL